MISTIITFFILLIGILFILSMFFCKIFKINHTTTFPIQKIAPLKQGWKCLLISPIVLYILLYTEIIYILVTKYFLIVYPAIILFLLLLILIKYLKFTNKINIAIVLIISLLPTAYFAKYLMENYIEEVALEKHDKQIKAHIRMNILASNNWIKDNHASIYIKNEGLMIWSIKEKDFIKYKSK